MLENNLEIVEEYDNGSYVYVIKEVVEGQAEGPIKVFFESADNLSDKFKDIDNE